MNQRPCRDCGAEAATGRSRCYPCYRVYRTVSDAVREETKARLTDPAERAISTRDADLAHEDTGTVTRVSEWQALGKGGEIVTLRSEKRTFVPHAEALTLAPAAPVTVEVSALRSAPDALGRTVLVLPDPQIGFRRTKAGEEPFHDDAAMDVAVKLASLVSPDEIVHLGDFLDFPSFSRFAQEPGFRDTTNRAAQRGREFLSALLEVTGARQTIIEGNHDMRIAATLAKLAPEAANLTPADDPDGWPLLSLPRLLGLSDLGVEYLDGYPATRLPLGGNTVAVHGQKVNSNGSTAAKIVAGTTYNTLFGHVHRQELQYRTLDDGRTIWAASPGTLARVDGGVPGFHSSVSSRTAASLPVQENWQQGAIVLHVPYDGDVWEAYPEMVRIHEGRAVYRGQLIQSDRRAA